jgi:predicted DNA binding CopG/RHH family protein
LNQMRVVKNGSTHLSTWVTAETKQRFSALAREFGLSESALLKRSITLMLQSTTAPDSALQAEPAKVSRDLRVYVRLSHDDHRLLAERAAARGMPAATYASYLLRSHLRGLAPLPDRELAALATSVSELGAVGRSLRQIANVASQTGRVEGMRTQDLFQILRALEALRDHTKNLIGSNLKSWETGHAAHD